MKRLENVIQPYAWGSRTALAGMRGAPPSDRPEAELWMGAHPAGPSQVVHAGNRRSLVELIAENPAQHLGAAVVGRLGPDLPFLLKVLAASTPLSLQTHPSLEQARAGFAREEQQRIPRDAPHRNYKDANHKPELICALTPFEALCGFRDPMGTLDLLSGLGVAGLEPLLAPLRRSPDPTGVRETFAALMDAPSGEHRRLVDAVGVACAKPGEPKHARERRWGARLAELYPGDPGVIGALMLNCISLKPLEAVYLPAGNLHAYLEGVGVEIMASSDNVLRGGCTPKHVDVPELLRVLDFRCGPVSVLRAEANPEGEAVYVTPAEAFRLSRVALTSTPRTLARRGAEILLLTEGTAKLRSNNEELVLAAGESLFVSAEEPPYSVAGHGTLFRASAGVV